MSPSPEPVPDVLTRADFTRDDPSDRYHRQKLLPWWDQGRVSAARAVVVGAGALGNEVVKLFALLGVGKVLLFDFDRVESSNLNRSVFFRAGDEGLPKAEVVARRAAELNPDLAVEARNGDVIRAAGLGVFLWADIVVGAVDNRLARLFVNSACARTGRAWVDGAIEGFAGTARRFDPAAGACYECTMNAVDRAEVARRRSCALLMRAAADAGRVPNTAVTASLVAALQVQEAVKALHGQPGLSGEGIHVDGLLGDYDRVRYPRREECPAHDTLGPLFRLDRGAADLTVGAVLEMARRRFGDGASIDLSRDVVHRLECPSCGRSDPAGGVVGSLAESAAACPACGAHRVAVPVNSLCEGCGVDPDRTLSDIGVPPYDILAVRRGLAPAEGWLLAGDAGEALGRLAGGPGSPEETLNPW
ncbi:MAG: ThiF family adenylyltransferase [Acidobacteria bacterium]|nr:ThiF family adenylyltransferase [Acidobacteriota bacterium]